MRNEPAQNNDLEDTRAKAWKRSSTAESEPTQNAGYRALSSLQLANNEHIVKSLFSKPIFDLGYGPTVDTMEDVNVNDPKYNLRYNRTVDLASQEPAPGSEYLPVDTLDHNRESTPTDPKPKVNGVMAAMGQRIINSGIPKAIAIETDAGDKTLTTEHSDEIIKTD